MSDVSELFDAKDRILMVAWALPNDGPLTDTQRRQAMDNFSNYMKRHGLTPTDVGKSIGKPRTTTIRDLMKGTFRDNADANIRKLNMWIEQHARQTMVRMDQPYVTTRVAKAMETVGRLCRENGTMAMALGPTGIGKSRCALAIHQTTVGSVYVRVMRGYHHSKGLTLAIAERIGVRGVKTNARERYQQFQIERVIETLRDTNRLVIVDEAHQLTDDALALVRDIHDTTGVPILLVATKDLLDRVERDIGPDGGQLYSRFDIIHHLSQGRDLTTDGKPLFSLEEIRALYQHPPIKLSADAARYLQCIANELGRGSLRRCEKLVRNAVRRARKRQGVADDSKVTVTADDLAWVENNLRQERSEREAVREHLRQAGNAAAV